MVLDGGELIRWANLDWVEPGRTANLWEKWEGCEGRTDTDFGWGRTCIRGESFQWKADLRVERRKVAHGGNDGEGRTWTCTDWHGRVWTWEMDELGKDVNLSGTWGLEEGRTWESMKQERRELVRRANLRWGRTCGKANFLNDNFIIIRPRWGRGNLLL